MTIAKNHGMLPTTGYGTFTCESKDVNIDLIDNVPIMTDEISVPKISIDPSVNTNSRKDREIERSSGKGQEG